ncbi:hypothetical protein [Tessaracoccus coleopterorum]|uniref:hypothetical protein n=1 Tax=Tessaracoccus coleopterorum TaxID=2714950 RepID=UPI0018D404CF|nr:hypothetical protein [Tessaracoccus coleopterorum]
MSADVVAAGTDTVVLGPADVTLKQDQLTVVYAWGSLEADNLALATQQVTLTADPGCRTPVPKARHPLARRVGRPHRGGGRRRGGDLGSRAPRHELSR